MSLELGERRRVPPGGPGTHSVSWNRLEKKFFFDFTKTRNLIWRRSNGLLCRANWKSLSSQEKTAALWADNNRTKQANAGSHFHLRDAARPVADRAHFVCRWDASKWRNGTREQIRFRPAAEEVSCHKLFHSDTFADESYLCESRKYVETFSKLIKLASPQVKNPGKYSFRNADGEDSIVKEIGALVKT